MIARTEPDRDGVVRPVVSETQMRAVGDDGALPGSLITRSRFECAQFAKR